MAHALDQHAERAYGELGTERKQGICERIFKALTDKSTDARGIRRPTRMDTLCALAGGVSQAEVTEVIDVFRKPSRSFLMPPAGEPLKVDTVIDISHESLMRVWGRLKRWGDEEARSAQMYRRLAETAELYAADKASLWRNPDLQLALDWLDHNQPNEIWAARYRPGFESAMKFLRDSKTAFDEQQAAERARAAREARRNRRQSARRQVLAAGHAAGDDAEDLPSGVAETFFAAAVLAAGSPSAADETGNRASAVARAYGDAKQG